MDHATAVAVVLNAVRRYNVEALRGHHIEEKPDSRLFGRGGPLDSLGLVNLVLLVEDGLAQDHNITITLADERALSQERSPFRDVNSLAAYICVLLNGPSHG